MAAVAAVVVVVMMCVVGVAHGPLPGVPRCRTGEASVLFAKLVSGDDVDRSKPSARAACVKLAAIS
jgi:hypothetical protein